jgi:exopolysaccharide biosynthesis polyprenyl glycosylphosphotransferase
MDTNGYQAANKTIEPPWLLPAVDVALSFLSFVLAYLARYDWQIIRPVFDPNRAGFEPYLPYAAAFALWLHMHNRGAGLYRPMRGRPVMDEIYGLINGVTNATLILMALSFVLQPLVFSRLMMIYVAVFAVLLMALARFVRRFVHARLRARGIGVQRTLVLGGGEVGLAVLRNMLGRKELGYFPVGFLDDDHERASADIGRVRALGTLANLKQVLRDQRVDTVVIALPWSERERIMRLLKVARKANVEVNLVPDVFELNLRQVQVDQLEGIPLLRVNGDVPFKSSNRLVKRVLDLVLTFISAPIWLAIFGIVALAIWLEDRGSLFYAQTRMGEHGKPFSILKFRSMIPKADELHGELVRQSGDDPRHPKLKDDPRITRVGRILRRTSIDELPQLLNVLKGEMSLVGPRPPTPDEVELYEPWHMQRLQVKPGMTGLWQVRGRSEVPFEEMCLLDIYYIENWSMQLDAQILMMTIPRVLLRQGAY